jgi:hypothetical protein
MRRRRRRRRMVVRCCARPHETRELNQCSDREATAKRK